MSSNVDVKAALAYQFPPITSTYNEQSCILYALGVGVGLQNPVDPKQLQYTYENSSPFKVIPTMGKFLVCLCVWLWLYLWLYLKKGCFHIDIDVLCLYLI
jgi:hypothetical protein